MAWRTLTSVRFAVLQIIALAVAGLIGTMVRQIPSFALRDPAAYAREIADLHQRYDPLSILGFNVGPGMVDLFERLGFFRVFSAPWFTFLLTLLVVSIVVCTADRTPRLWRGVRLVRVAQPAGFFDLRLPERAAFAGVELSPEELARLIRSRRFKVRQEEGGAASSDVRPRRAAARPPESGAQPPQSDVHPPESAAHPPESAVRFVYGDRNQYFKMATLFTHLGLILFLAGGAVTGALGFETVVFVGEGQTAPVQPVGTPNNLLVKNVRFEAPTRPDGSFEDFRTDLAVYQNGREIGRKTIQVNDPLSLAGFVFHQNTFGPAADLQIRDPGGRLVWTGPVLLAGQLLELPQGFMTIPGSDIGLLVLLTRDASGTPELVLTGIASAPDGAASETLFLTALDPGGTTDPRETAGYEVTWTRASAFTGMVIKNDPGQGLIWLAYLSLISGLILTFYFPRRRVWARYEGGRLQLAMLADRYVDARKEFGQLLEDIAARTGRLPERVS